MANPVKEYYKNGNIKSESWYEEGNRHRIDGPAYIKYYYYGNIWSNNWYVRGKAIKPAPYDHYPLTKEEQVELKLIYG